LIYNLAAQLKRLLLA